MFKPEKMLRISPGFVLTLRFARVHSKEVLEA